MRRQRLNSSSLRSVGYDEFSQDLEVEFTNGSIYRYHGVPYETYLSLMRASSKGRFVNWQIKGVFSFTEIENRDRLSNQIANKISNDDMRR